MQGLLTLEELEVKNCGELLEVFKLEGLLSREGEQQNLLHPRLKKIFLHDLLELRCIWKGPTQYLNLNNLEELEVFGCNKLKHLFTPILARSLQSLKRLEIRTCDEVEYLIAKDEEDQILSENHLQPLYFPKLEIVSVKGCNKLKFLFPITMADSLLKLTILKVKGASQLAEVFTNEDKGDIVVQKDVRLPQICKIALKGLPSLVNFCPRNYHAILPKLSCLKVQRCPNMTTKFTRTPDKSVHINGEVCTHYPTVFIFIFTQLLVVVLLLIILSCLVLIKTLLFLYMSIQISHRTKRSWDKFYYILMFFLLLCQNSRLLSFFN
jgi:hypothetical protein